MSNKLFISILGTFSLILLTGLLFIAGTIKSLWLGIPCTLAICFAGAVSCVGMLIEARTARRLATKASSFEDKLVYAPLARVVLVDQITARLQAQFIGLFATLCFGCYGFLLYLSTTPFFAEHWVLATLLTIGTTALASCHGAALYRQYVVYPPAKARALAKSLYSEISQDLELNNHAQVFRFGNKTKAGSIALFHTDIPSKAQVAELQMMDKLLLREVYSQLHLALQKLVVLQCFD